MDSIPYEKFLHAPQHHFPVMIGHPPTEVIKGKHISIKYSMCVVPKSTIFLVCVTICLYQSVDFYKHYFTYPLTTSITVINPKYYKIPAITFCVRSPFKMTDFCQMHPTFCQRPLDLDDFCQLHPHYCKRDRSKLSIRQTGYYTAAPSEELEEFLFQSFRYYNTTKGYPLSINDKDLKNVKYTVVENPFEQEVEHGKFMRCFSSNLHISIL